MVVQLWTDQTQRLDPGTVLASVRGDLRVVSSKPFGGDRFIVQFEGVADRTSAERLRGVELEAEPLDEPDVMWVHELVGAVVRDAAGTELGRVEAVEANPASDLLVLESGGSHSRALRHLPRPGRDARSRWTSPRGCSSCEARGMRIDVFTIFPDVVVGYCGASILGRAVDAGALDVRVHDLREGADDPRRSVDDSPFGGGAGMVLMAEPLFRRVESVPDLPRPLYLLAPGGRRFDQEVAAELAALEAAPSGGFSLLCGRYEGVDQRVADHLVDDELSVGDFVLAGGELAALVVVEAVARLLPEVLGNEDSARGGELHRRPARVPPVHPAGRVQGVGGARGAALRGPRSGGRLAAHPGPGADGRAAA